MALDPKDIVESGASLFGHAYVSFTHRPTGQCVEWQGKRLTQARRQKLMDELARKVAAKKEGG